VQSPSCGSTAAGLNTLVLFNTKAVSCWSVRMQRFDLLAWVSSSSCQERASLFVVWSSFAVGPTRSRCATPACSLGLRFVRWSLLVFGLGGGLLCRGSLRRWSVGWHERGMATNHDKCRGWCFYDAHNGPPTPGSPLPLFPTPFSSVGKARARPHPSGEGRGVGLRLVLRIAGRC
jgi:hypothetical protein